MIIRRSYSRNIIRLVGLDSRLTTAENDIDYLTDEVVAIQNTLSDHETRIDALEYATTPLAQQYVSELQNLSSLQGQGQALNQYYNSQQYKDLAGQARYQSLAAAEATGGLGSTATGNQLAAIAPTLGQNWLSGQMNNYNNLANIGLGALTGQANAGQNYANNVSQLYQQQAAAAAANANKPSGFQSALGGAAAGAAMGTAIMPGWGTAIGAGVGLLGSLF
ncbi:DNA transfer protein [Escherichia coli]|uniref:DNA transfer protein n=1 Tax=Escherichia coli TaxID=562 RepID=UPI00207B4C98|nr:DNA transfer protein [Escherichia coli]